MRKIVHISDIHFGRADLAVVERLVEKIVELEPHLLVVSGDLTQRARTREFVAARAFLDRLKMPQIVVPGNHDVPMYNVFDRFVNPLEKFQKFITDDLQPFFSDDAIAVIGLNTARSMTIKGGRINKEQIAEIGRRISGLGETILKVIVTHHPFDVPEGRDEDDIVGNADESMPVISASGADVFLAGHLHISSITHSARRYKLPNGRSALIIQAGTAASVRVRGEVNSFNLLSFENPQLFVTRFDCVNSGTTFVPADAEKFTHGANGWSSA